MRCFEGKKAVVVGGSGGIGAAVSLRLAEQGAVLTVHGGHTSDKFDALMRRITALSPDSAALVQPIEAADFPALQDSPLVRAVRDCDVLCVCYGPFVQKPFAQTSLADWQTVSLLDYALPGFLTSVALDGMAQKKWGRILLFGGTGTSRRAVFRTNAAYAGAKAGLHVLVQSVAASYAACGITCNAVLPGGTQTEYTPPNGKNLPFDSLLSADAVAGAAIFLLSHADANGVLFPLDRGWFPT